MLQALMGKVFGTSNDRELKKYAKRVKNINALESKYEVLSDEDLKEKFLNLKKSVLDGEKTLDDVMEESFAITREASKRVLNMRHFDVQLVGGIVLHEGRIAEMKTGEGKTLVATLAIVLNAMTGKGVHLVTVNDYLASRDAADMGVLYNFLGFSVGVILEDEHDPEVKKAAYNADITYGTNNEFGFDYLRDNMSYSQEYMAQRGHNFVIVDEVDSILIDEARTPLIISGPTNRNMQDYIRANDIAMKLQKDTHFTVDEKDKVILITEEGITKAEELFSVENLYSAENASLPHALDQALKANYLFERDVDYVVNGGEVVIVDEFTGRMQPGRRWSDGLHQAVEAKEGLAIQKESRTFASITYQNYFRMYEKLAGMTGTAETSSEEFYTVYKLDVVQIPTNKPVARIDYEDFIFINERGKLKAIARKVRELYEKGQPVLIGTVSIEKNEELSEYLKKEGIPHEILNAKNHEREGEIIAQAGKKGNVTIATNMAGRGVDIKLGGVPFDEKLYEEVKEIGGLFVLGTERHEARRIDNQLRGRAGRQGDPGETQFFVSLDDHLMRVFGNNNMIRNIMKKATSSEDEPIKHKMISNSLETAQKRIEGFNFDSRKHILAYDDVLSKQRESIYKRRRKYLKNDIDAINDFLSKVISFNSELEDVIEEKKKVFGEDEFYGIVRRLLLQTVDFFWLEHLETMEYLRSSVNLRAYGQRDPLIEYRKVGLATFQSLEAGMMEKVAESIPQIGAGAFETEEERMRQASKQAQKSAGADSSSNTNVPIKTEKKIGRNEIVRITNGKETKEIKYKKAERFLENGDWNMIVND
jgi:preprotein translocase subunit SecA